MFPCRDEPEIKTIFNITVIHPSDYKVLSNAQEQLKRHQAIVDKILWTSFMSTTPIAASEVAFVIIDSNMKRYVYPTTDILWCYLETKKKLDYVNFIFATVRMSLSNYTMNNSISKTEHVIPKSPMKVVESHGLILYRYITD